jgi:hypothetical protein
MAVFSDLSPCRLVDIDRLSYDLTAFIIRVIPDQTTRCYSPENSDIHTLLSEYLKYHLISFLSADKDIVYVEIIQLTN